MSAGWMLTIRRGKRATNPPKIFGVNWFCRNDRGQFLWPGFGDNLRVLRWIVERSHGTGEATETPIGYLPKPSSLNGGGLKISASDFERLLAVDRDGWKNNLKGQMEFFDNFGDRLPAGIKEEHAALGRRLKR